MRKVHHAQHHDSYAHKPQHLLHKFHLRDLQDVLHFLHHLQWQLGTPVPQVGSALLKVPGAPAACFYAVEPIMMLAQPHLILHFNISSYSILKFHVSVPIPSDSSLRVPSSLCSSFLAAVGAFLCVFCLLLISVLIS